MKYGCLLTQKQHSAEEMVVRQEAEQDKTGGRAGTIRSRDGNARVQRDLRGGCPSFCSSSLAHCVLHAAHNFYLSTTSRSGYAPNRSAPRRSIFHVPLFALACRQHAVQFVFPDLTVAEHGGDPLPFMHLLLMTLPWPGCVIAIDVQHRRTTPHISIRSIVSNSKPSIRIVMEGDGPWRRYAATRSLHITARRNPSIYPE